MNRRTFLKAVAAAAITMLRPGTAAADLPKAKITRPNLSSAQSQPAFQSEQHGGDRRDRSA